MRIYVPSRGRASHSFLISGAYTPLRWLTPALCERTVFCVRSDELEKYEFVLKNTGVTILDCGLPENLSKKRDIIFQHVQKNEEKKFMMCDDDVMLYVRKSPDVFNLRYADKKTDEVEVLMKHIEKYLDMYAMVGISPREGNNRIGNGPFPLIRECTRSMRMYAFHSRVYSEIQPNRLSEMADFDTTLQLLRKGYKNAVLYFWAQGQPGSQHAGGCSVYRTPETHDAICRKLAELHPGFVRLVQKQNKGDQHGFGTRTEVVVSWKKAYESSFNQEEAA